MSPPPSSGNRLKRTTTETSREELYTQAKREPDERRRRQLLQDCQQIEYDEGGYIIWGFKKQVDAFSNLVQGMQPSRYLPCGSFKFHRVSFV